MISNTGPLQKAIKSRTRKKVPANDVLVYSTDGLKAASGSKALRSVDTFGGPRGKVLTPEQQYRRELRQSVGVTDIRRTSGGSLSRLIRAGLAGGPGDPIGSRETVQRIRRAKKRYGI